MDRCGACIVPLYKGKDDKCECSNSRGISLLSVVGKLYGRVMIKSVWVGTEGAIGEEQYWSRKAIGFMDQVFAVRHVCEKYLANGNVNPQYKVYCNMNVNPQCKVYWSL